MKFVIALTGAVLFLANLSCEVVVEEKSRVYVEPAPVVVEKIKIEHPHHHHELEVEIK